MSDPITILPHVDSDMSIPPVSDILARCADLRSDALHMGDTATAQQIKLLTAALDGGMRMAWSYGDLIVSSASTPGAYYTVSCGACTCPARKPCKHLKLAEVLLDMLDTLAGDADLEAGIDEWEFDAAMADYPDYTPVAPRIVAARRTCWASL